jgi:hypothetical protein
VAILFATLALLGGTRPLRAAGVAPGLSGVVRDATGAPVAGAAASLVTPLGSVAATARTDAAGAFRLEGVPPGSYVLAVEVRGFATHRLAVRVQAERAGDPLEVELQPEGYRDEITVTATPGRAAALEEVAQRVNVVGEEEIAIRAKAVLAQAASRSSGRAPPWAASSCAG